MNKYQKAIEVIDTLLHLMCEERRESCCTVPHLEMRIKGN